MSAQQFIRKHQTFIWSIVAVVLLIIGVGGGLYVIDKNTERVETDLKHIVCVSLAHQQVTAIKTHPEDFDSTGQLPIPSLVPFCGGTADQILAAAADGNFFDDKEIK